MFCVCLYAFEVGMCVCACVCVCVCVCSHLDEMELTGIFVSLGPWLRSQPPLRAIQRETKSLNQPF
jgi:hypothetical protein